MKINSYRMINAYFDNNGNRHEIRTNTNRNLTGLLEQFEEGIQNIKNEFIRTGPLSLKNPEIMKLLSISQQIEFGRDGLDYAYKILNTDAALANCSQSKDDFDEKPLCWIKNKDIQTLKSLADIAHKNYSVAINDLVSNNLKLVMFSTKQFRGKPHYLDMVQEGNLGLIRAAEKFNGNLDIKFSTYAVNWIKQFIQRASRNYYRNVRVPDHLHEMNTKILRAKEKNHDFDDTNIKNISVLTGLTENNVSYAQEALQLNISIDNFKTDNDEYSGDSLTPQALHYTDELTEKMDVYQALTASLDKLNNLQRSIVSLKFGFNSPKATIDEISIKLNISKSRVRNEYNCALTKLRKTDFIKELT